VPITLDSVRQIAMFPCFETKGITMAKKNTILVKLESSADTGFYYVKKRNPRKQPEKMTFKKYDPVVRKHVVFNETKLKS
jgi:large subunit ribosomal protein L33